MMKFWISHSKKFLLCVDWIFFTILYFLRCENNGNCMINPWVGVPLYVVGAERAQMIPVALVASFVNVSFRYIFFFFSPVKNTGMGRKEQDQEDRWFLFASFILEWQGSCLPNLNLIWRWERTWIELRRINDSLLLLQNKGTLEPLRMES